MSSAGLIALASTAPHVATVRRLDASLAQRGLTVMLRWDHAAAAVAAGLSMPPSLLVLFGDPRVGTALMQARPSVAIDLPLKLLVWDDASGGTWVGYNDPAWLRTRHGLAAPADGADRMADQLHRIASEIAGGERGQ